MKNIKSFKLFESNSISNLEVENLINDILLDLKDINDGFSWKIEFFLAFWNPEHDPEHDFIWGRLYITCSDISNIHGWTDILDRLFSILIEEGLKIYVQRKTFTEPIDQAQRMKQRMKLHEVKPGEIEHDDWSLSRIVNPMTFEYDIKWFKEFVIKR